MFLFLFFFSSRRRHTRLVSDWSSDVCSSDLIVSGGIRPAECNQVANTVLTFGCIPLDEFLRSRFRLTALPVRAKAYLYEAICGTTISAIGRNESRVPILGPGARKPWNFFLPLTCQTAGMLFGEPNLGRDVPTKLL